MDGGLEADFEVDGGLFFSRREFGLINWQCTERGCLSNVRSERKWMSKSAACRCYSEKQYEDRDCIRRTRVSTGLRSIVNYICLERHCFRIVFECSPVYIFSIVSIAEMKNWITLCGNQYSSFRSRRVILPTYLHKARHHLWDSSRLKAPFLTVNYDILCIEFGFLRLNSIQKFLHQLAKTLDILSNKPVGIKRRWPEITCSFLQVSGLMKYGRILSSGRSKESRSESVIRLRCGWSRTIANSSNLQWIQGSHCKEWSTADSRITPSVQWREHWCKSRWRVKTLWQVAMWRTKRSV